MFDFPITITRKRIKNLNLRINRTGEVKLSVPLRCLQKTIELFLDEKRDWIHQHRLRLLQQNSSLSKLIQHGDIHYYLGEPYQINIISNHNCNRLVCDNQTIYLFLKDSSSFQDMEKLLENWCRQEMKKRIPDLLRKWEPIINVKANEWGIKKMKSRWGSCNTVKKRIWLNLNLMQKPLLCLEYVLVHELVHLLEPSHNQRFYNLMTQFMPDWKKYKRELL